MNPQSEPPLSFVPPAPVRPRAACLPPVPLARGAGGHAMIPAGEPSSLLTSLVSHWKLEDVADSAGANTLTNNGTTTFTAGKIGLAATLNGTNQWLSRADNASLSTGDIDFTWAAWVNAAAFGSGANNYVVHKLNEYGLLFHDFGVGDPRFCFLTNDGTNIVHATLPNPPLVATWYFLVGWHDAAGDTVNIQVDNGTVYSAATGGTAPSDGAGDLQIGRYDAGSGLYWSGQIDSVSFWKRVLTAGERLLLYNGGQGLDHPFS